MPDTMRSQKEESDLSIKGEFETVIQECSGLCPLEDGWREPHDLSRSIDCKCKCQGEARKIPCDLPALSPPSEGITEPGAQAGNME